MPSKDVDPEPEAAAVRELNDLVEQARAGDETVLPQLRQALREHPEIWNHFGNLANHVQLEWIKLLGGSDLAIKESLLRKVESLRAELEGPSPSSLERLLCDAVVTTWLEAEYFGILIVSSGERGTARQIESLHIRRDASHKRHLTAMKALAEVRKLLPTAFSQETSGPHAIHRSAGKSIACSSPAATRVNAPEQKTIPMKGKRKG